MEHWTHFIMSICKPCLVEIPLLFQNGQLDKSNSCWGGRCHFQTSENATDFYFQKKNSVVEKTQQISMKWQTGIS